jgi:hypothetical protein
MAARLPSGQWKSSVLLTLAGALFCILEREQPAKQINETQHVTITKKETTFMRILQNPSFCSF